MSLTKLKQLHDAMPVVMHHYGAHRSAAPYGVWAEDGDVSPGADNRRSTVILSGTTDYFTKTEDDPNVDAIQAAFEGARAWIAAQINSVQYEDDTGLVHYEWAWEAVI